MALCSPYQVCLKNDKLLFLFKDQTTELCKLSTDIIVDFWRLITENYKGHLGDFQWLTLGAYSPTLDHVKFPEGLSDKHFCNTAISGAELEAIKRYIYKIKCQKSQAPLHVQLNYVIQGAVLFSNLVGVSQKHLNAIIRYNAQRNTSLESFIQNPFAFRPKGVPINEIDAIALQLGFDKAYRTLGIVTFIIEEAMNNQGDMYVSLDTITFQLTKLGCSALNVWELLNASSQEFVCVSKDEIYLKYVYEIQEFIVENLCDYLEADAEEWKELKGELGEKITNAIDSWETTNDIQLAKEQRKAVEWFLLGRRVFSVCGSAGTGKSLVIKVMVELGEALWGWRITCMAPTGKASMRLPKGCTIHRYLAENDLKEALGSARSIDSPDVIIIDETSMADVALIKSLMEASSPKQFVFVGDDAQLPPVRWGNFYKEIIRSKAISHLRLVHTFRNKLGILNLANKIRNGERLTKQDLNNTECTTLLEPVDLVEYLSTDAQIISPTRDYGNGGVSKLNTIVHQKVYKTASSHPCPTETVIITKNYYDPESGKLNASNGDIGQFMEYKKKFAYVKLDRTGIVVKVSREDVELAHALTVHKTQGSEYDVVLLVLLDVPRPLATRELLYTAVTRAKKRLVIISDPQTLQLCAKQQMNKRKCKLGEYLDACLA
jgi:exodeoxyribonuclease V alpha subunit